ncbi:putative 3-hydroxyisobutyryl-CoA hydrolase [Helianthus annuus]|nr:putative 3-hydroxyisobutyryl-CoA hydrolase [Helianthus annuus]
MPETALGSFPDVGASYYLSRLPGFFGEYVGLMGARLDGAEMLVCGLATHFVPLEKLSSLDDALCKATTGDPKIINNIILHDFSNKNPTLKEKSHYFRLKTINSCFSRRTVEEIISALEEGDKKMDDWISWTIQALKKASATSLKISLRSVEEKMRLFHDEKDMKLKRIDEKGAEPQKPFLLIIWKPCKVSETD